MKTIEEKAKAYDEALKWMRELYPGLHGATKEDAEHYFPQLRESEDERIRKWLVDYFGSIKDTVWIHRDITCEQILEWLEKQKEQKSAVSREGILHQLFQNGSITLSDYLYLTEEQKPVEKQDYSGLTDFEQAIHRGFLCAGVENVPVTIIKETAQDCLAKQKAEWSEEDEKMLSGTLDSLKRYQLSMPNYQVELQMRWLKSIRPHSQWKPSEEQTDALLYAMSRVSPATKESVILSELYERLKELKQP